MSATAEILARLRRADQRRRVIEASRLIAGALAAALSCAIIIALVDIARPLPPWLRAMGGAYAILMPVFAAGRALAAARASRHEAIAEAFERACPSLEGHLFNAVGFARDPRAPGSPILKEAEIEVAAERLRACETAAAFPAAGLRRPAAHLGAAVAVAALAWLLAPAGAARQTARIFDPRGGHAPIALATLEWIEPAQPIARVRDGGHLRLVVAARGSVARSPILVQQLPNAEESAAPFWTAGPGLYEIRIGPLREDRTVRAEIPGSRARSEDRVIAIVRAPRVESVEIAIEPPPYTRLAPRRVALAGAEVEVFEGSRVVALLAADRPIESARAEIEAAGAAPIAVDLPVDPGLDGTAARGRIPIASSARITFVVRDETGEEGRSDPPARIAVRRDAPPRIEILVPGRESLAVPGARLPVRAAASDDIGIRDVAIAIAGREDGARTFAIGGDRAAIVEHAIVLDGTAAGETLRITATATDTRPGEGGIASAEPAIVRIVSSETLAEMARKTLTLADLVHRYEAVRERLVALRDRAVQELRDLLAVAAPSERALDGLRRRQASLVSAVFETGEEIASYAEGPAIYEFDEVSRAALAGIARDLAAAGAGGAATPGATPSESLGALRDRQGSLASALAAACDAFDRAIRERLVRLARIFAIVRELEGFRRLHEDARALAQALAEPAPAPAPLAVVADGIAQACRRIIAGLRDAAEDAREGFPKASESALEIADAIGAARIAEGFERAGGALGAGDLDAARREVAAAIAAMEKLATRRGESGTATAPRPIDEAISLAFEGPGAETLRSLADGIESPLEPGARAIIRPDEAGAEKPGLFGPGGALSATGGAKPPPPPPPLRAAERPFELVAPGGEDLGGAGGTRILARYEGRIAAFRRWLEAQP
ncbi:MAG: hypothetical protein JXP34_05965 [Planctomycetes bacterium]|nr:hypothetical protein [Planctomycetota bacterium]